MTDYAKANTKPYGIPKLKLVNSIFAHAVGVREMWVEVHWGPTPQHTSPRTPYTLPTLTSFLTFPHTSHISPHLF